MDSSLLLDLYELTMAEAYFTYKRGAFATFDLFVRNMPKNRSYLVACGLEDVLNYLEGLKFTRHIRPVMSGPLRDGVVGSGHSVLDRARLGVARPS